MTSSLMRGIVKTLASFIVAASVWANAAVALAQPIAIDGWWRAEISAEGEVSEIYLRFFEREDGANIAALLLPAANTREAPLSRYEVIGASVQMPSVRWALEISEDRTELRGVLPEALVPDRTFEARFVRSNPPLANASPLPSQRAPEPAWVVETGTPIWAGLTYDRARNAVLVAGDDGTLRALDARDGVFRWALDLGAAVRATPTIRRDRAFVSTDIGLVAIDLRRARILWRTEYGPQRVERLPLNDANSLSDHYSGSAVLHGGHLFVVSRDGCVYSLRADSGSQRWRVCVDSGPLTATPAVHSRNIMFAGYDGAVRALDLQTGVERWRVETGGAVSRDLIVDGDQVLVGSRTYDLFALDARNGSTKWRRHFFFSWIDSPPTVRDGRIFVGSSDALSVNALDAESGRRVWSASLPGWVWPRVAVTNTNVYAGVVGVEGYIGDRRGAFAAIDRETGGLRWMVSSEPGASLELYGFASAPLVIGNRVYSADLAGRVYAFEDRSPGD